MTTDGPGQPGAAPPVGRVGWGVGDVVAGLAVVLVLPSVAVVVGLALAGVDADESDTIPLWGVALLQIPLWVALGGFPWWVARRKGSGRPADDLGLRVRLGDLWRGVVAGIGSQVALSIVLIPVYFLLGIDQSDVGETAEKLADRADGALGVASLFLVAVLAAAVLEEVFYRGFVLQAIRARWGDRAAIAGSGLVFGVMHFQPVDTIALALFGAVLAWLTVRYGRLGPAIVAHLTFNLTAFVVLLTG